MEQPKHPNLQRLLDNGVMYIDGGREYLGWKNPEQLWSFGYVGGEEEIEEYLRDFPNPENWPNQS